MSATGMNASTQACRPLVNCIVNQWLLQAMPHTHSIPVAAHQCHELWFHKDVAECLQRAFIPVPRYAKDIKIRWGIPELWLQMCCHFLHILRVHYEWEMDCFILQGSVSTLFRWGGHIFQVCLLRFFLLTAMQKLYKSSVIFQSYVKCTATIFWPTLYIHGNV